MDLRPGAACATRAGQRINHRSRGQRRSVAEVNAGAKPELPAVIVVLRLPAHGQRRLRRTIRIDAREAVEDQAPRQAAVLLACHCPRIANDLDAQSAAVVRPGARQGRNRQHHQDEAEGAPPSPRLCPCG